MQNLMPPVNTPDNLFHDGNESTGIEGTILYAEFMNNEQSAVQDIQQEAINVLAAAGFTPDPAKNNQLLMAIQKIISDGITDGVKGLIKTVNGKEPDDLGNIQLNASDVDALPSGGTAAAATKLATAHKIAGHPFDGTEDLAISAGDVGAMPYFGTALSVDLNTLGAYSAAGVHYQQQNAGATTEDHYPIAEAGSLLVTPSAYGCQQEYTTFSSGRKFVRGLTGAWNGSDGPWGVWTEILSTTEGDTRYQPKGNYTPEGQAYTKTESDARYIQNVQRGAAVTPPKANEYGPNEAPAGCVLTRAWHDPDTAYGVFFTYRPLQIFINGAWRTIAG